MLIYTGLLFHSCCCCIRVLSSIISCICHEVTFHMRQEEPHTAPHFRDDIYVIVTTSKLLMLQKCFCRCTNGRCIDINKVCDFRDDCLDKDNSDEANCPATCNFEKGYCKWTNAQVGDHYDWIRYKGKTPSNFTGPSTDHTPNTAGLCHFSRFLYIIKRGFINKSSDNHGLPFLGFHAF